MPDWFTQNAPTTAGGDWFAQNTPKQSPVSAPRQPVVTRAEGDTFADKIRNAVDAIGPRARGFAKSAAHTALDIGEMGLSSGMIPGGSPGLPNNTIDEMRAATAYRNKNRFDLSDPENQGAALETVAELAMPAYELGKAGMVAARGIGLPAVGNAAKSAGSVALDVATGHPVKAAGKLLGWVLDSAQAAKAAAKAAPTAVSEAGSRIAVETPTATVPAGNVVLQPSAWSMPPASPAAARPPVRIVPAQTPTTTQAITDALEAVRQPVSAPPVELPPPPSLPAGYTPRTTAPRLKASTPTTPAPEPATPPKRAYFLKPKAEIQAATEAAAEPVAAKPTGQISVEDLPASWRAHTGQDLFPMTGALGKEVEAAFLAEIKDRGVSVSKAMMEVSKNKDLPVQVRQQLLKALSRVNLKGAK